MPSYKNISPLGDQYELNLREHKEREQIIMYRLINPENVNGTEMYMTP